MGKGGVMAERRKFSAEIGKEQNQEKEQSFTPQMVDTIQKDRGPTGTG